MGGFDGDHVWSAVNPQAFAGSRETEAEALSCPPVNRREEVSESQPELGLIDWSSFEGEVVGTIPPAFMETAQGVFFLKSIQKSRVESFGEDGSSSQQVFNFDETEGVRDS